MSIDMVYERDLRSMKLLTLKGTRQDEAVLALAKRLGLTRQQMRKILIAKCDMMTLENIAPRLLAADAALANSNLLAMGLSGAKLSNAELSNAELAAADYLSLPHLTTALGIFTNEEASYFLNRVNSGAKLEDVKQEILEALQ